MKSLCQMCFTSNVSCIINAKSGLTECTRCLKKAAEKEVPDLKCYCKDCSFHNPIQTNSEPIPLDIPLEVTPEG